MDFALVAEAMGPNCTPRAVQEQIKKLKKLARQGGELPVVAPKTATAPKGKKGSVKNTKSMAPAAEDGENDTEDAPSPKKVRRAPAAAKFGTAIDASNDKEAEFKGDAYTDAPVVKKGRKAPAKKKAAPKVKTVVKTEEDASKKGVKRKYEESEEDHFEENNAEEDPIEEDHSEGAESELEDLDREILGEA